jgi:hypothetical protein
MSISLLRAIAFVVLATLACGGIGCGGRIGGAASRPMGALEARWRLRDHGGAARRSRETSKRSVAATRIYRNVLSLSLGSKCRMVPSDSRLYDLRARRCGGLLAAYLGIARLLLEVEASPRVLRPTLYGGRVGWFDLPRTGPCAP